MKNWEDLPSSGTIGERRRVGSRAYGRTDADSVPFILLGIRSVDRCVLHRLHLTAAYT